MRRSTILIALAVLVAHVAAGPLYDYVHAPDPTFKWQVANSIDALECTCHNVFVTSQTWLTEADSSRPVWTHWAQVMVPKHPRNTDTAAIYIDGGSSPEFTSPPGSPDPLTEILCNAAGTVAVHLSAVPNEPITFPGDWRHKSRSEDAIIAFTWSMFLNSSSTNPEWLLRFPMTKAASAAMTAAEEFVATLPASSGVQHVKKWLVAGASKRGWTTWTLCGVDDRCVAMVPIVMPNLDLVPQIEDMWKSYGDWSFALDDYVQEGCIKYLKSERFQQIMDLVGPLAFNKNYTGKPILAVTDVADEFFLPNGIDFGWDELGGLKNHRVVANAEHSLTGHQIDVTATVTDWYTVLLDGAPMPNMTSEISADGQQITATVTSTKPPKKCIMWHAYNSKTRDFRWITCADPKDPKCLNPILWGPRDLTPMGNGTTGVTKWMAEMYPPQTGWAGFMIECEFDVGTLSLLDPLKLTSGVSILPLSYPYPPCPETACGETPPGLDASTAGKWH